MGDTVPGFRPRIFDSIEKIVAYTNDETNGKQKGKAEAKPIGLGRNAKLPSPGPVAKDPSKTEPPSPPAAAPASAPESPVELVIRLANLAPRQDLENEFYTADNAFVTARNELDKKKPGPEQDKAISDCLQKADTLLEATNNLIKEAEVAIAHTNLSSNSPELKSAATKAITRYQNIINKAYVAQKFVNDFIDEYKPKIK